MRDGSGQGPPSNSQREDILFRMKEKQWSFCTEGRRKEFNWSVITSHVWSIRLGEIILKAESGHITPLPG